MTAAVGFWLAAATFAQAQVYPNINPNTVLGRLGAGQAGQPQAIPLSTLYSILIGPSTPVTGLTPNGVEITNGYGAPSISTTLPSGLTIPSPIFSGQIPTIPPVATSLTIGLCTGSSSGDAVELNTLLGVYPALGLPATATCQLSAALLISQAFAALQGASPDALIEPSASVTELLNMVDTGSANAYGDIKNLALANVSSYATDGIHYNTAQGNNFPQIHGNHIAGFTNAVLDDSTSPGGDGLNVYNNFFLNNSNAAVNFANEGVNSSIHSNYVLGGPGFLFNVAGQQNEGTRIYDNTVLSSTSGASSIIINGALEEQIFGNILDQNYAHGIILNASSNPVSAIKIVSDWIGASGSVAASQDGIHMSGAPEYVPIIGDTITGWSGYGVNTGAGGAQHLMIAFSKFYNNSTGDLNMDDVTGGVLIGNYFGSTASWAEASMASGLVAVGNRCAASATGIGAADLILGDGSCGANQIPGPLTITGGGPIYGGSSAGSTLTIQSTSNGSPSGDEIFLKSSKFEYETIGGTDIFDYGITTASTLTITPATVVFSGGTVEGPSGAALNVKAQTGENLILNAGSNASACLGAAGTEAICVNVAASAVYPNADNTYSIGNSSDRWTGVYSMNYYAGSSNVQGVSCGPASPTSSWQTVDGITTHC